MLDSEAKMEMLEELSQSGSTSGKRNPAKFGLTTLLSQQREDEGFKMSEQIWEEE